MNTEQSLLKPIVILALLTGIALLIPLIAMQFTAEVVWTISDFIFAGVLLFGTGLTYILVTQKASELSYRFAIGFALFTGLLLIWVNGAVGIIGSEDSPANLMYFGVIATGIIGAFMARFKPQGMAFAMFAMALAQAVVATIILIGGMYKSPPSSIIEILAVNGFFITLFIISALSFRIASKNQMAANANAKK